MTGILQKIERRIALRFLNRMRTVYGARYPQMAVYSFDYIGNVISTHGRFDAEMLDFLLSLLGPETRDQTALDIGANIGNHAVAFSERFRTVVAFEPNPRVLKVLRINAEHAGNVEVVPYGLSNGNAEVDAEFLPLNLGGGAMIPTGSIHAGAQTFRMTLRRLDDLRIQETYGQIGLVKIDVEGHELEVIEGARETLAALQPPVLVELAATSINAGECDVLEGLRGIGYKFFYEIRRTRVHPLLDILGIGPKGRDRWGLHALTRMETRFHDAVLASATPLNAKS